MYLFSQTNEVFATAYQIPFSYVDFRVKIKIDHLSKLISGVNSAVDSFFGVGFYHFSKGK